VTAPACRCTRHARAKLASLRPDEVLVVDAFPHDWLHLCPDCHAVIAQTGGLLQFSARWLRWRGIPAVLAVPDALMRVADGDVVEVDGSHGHVYLSPATPRATFR
jgi:pyruvate,water dikinase